VRSALATWTIILFFSDLSSPFFNFFRKN